MAVNNTITNLSSLFKEVYAPSLKWLMPKGLRVQNLIEYGAADASPGGLYHQPVVTQHEHGFTYKEPRVDAFDINAAISGASADAQIEGTQMILESFLGYEAAARASSGGKRAFIQATQYLVENMWQSARKRLEIDLMYGRSGLGTLAGAIATNTITITAAEWSPGIWAASEGATVEITNTFTYPTGPTTSRGVGIIESVDMAARTVTFVAGHTFTGTAAGDVLWFGGNTNGTATPAANKGQIFVGSLPAGETLKFKSMLGLHLIGSIGAGTTLFNVSTNYSLWRANTVSAASVNLSFETIMRAIAAAVGKGLDEELTLLVNPLTWATLLTDQAALHRHGDSKGASYEIGSDAILFHSMVGTIKIVSSIYCKEGYAYMIAPSLFKRIGSTDLTFRLPDRGDEFFYQHPTKTAYGLRCYTSQALFTEAPGKMVLITSIDNA